jgi:ABC-type polysaccharide/polyol phosphate transport system ATPase subunit
MSAIEFNHVTKTYRLGSRAGLREMLMSSLAAMTRRSQFKPRYFNALEDVSFSVDQGEVVGLVGHNGAGKTTVLKLLSRVTYPTSGKISVQGRISALIELGAGFHPDLSGAENIYLNASILGLKEAEIKARFDEIVAFSGLEKFIDTPLKRYSSGMYARLAFSVAAHVDPDVLLVDEVLSVGDALFQEKSLNKMKQFKEQGRPMIFVSHNLIAVQSICSRVIWLDRGKIKAAGDPETVISQYLRDRYYEQKDVLSLEEGEDLAFYREGDVLIDAIRILDHTGQPVETINGGSSVKVEIRYTARRPILTPSFNLYLTLQNHRVTGSTFVKRNGVEPAVLQPGSGVVTCSFESTPVLPAAYYFNLDLLEENRLMYRQKEIGPLIIIPNDSASRWEEYNLFDVKCHWNMEQSP